MTRTGESPSTRSDPKADRPTLEELYDQYSGPIFGHCLRVLGNKADAEDAMQETFVNAQRALSDFENRSGYLSWLFRIATNTCINEIRRKRRTRSKLREIAATDAGSSHDPDQVAWARELLKRMVTKLKERDLEIITAHFIGGMDQSQVAKSMGISRRAVAKRLRKIRDRLGREWPQE